MKRHANPEEGIRRKSLNEQHIQALVNYVEENSLITLQEIIIDHNISLSTT